MSAAINNKKEIIIQGEGNLAYPAKVEKKDHFDAFTKTLTVCEHIDLTFDNVVDLTIEVKKEPVEKPQPEEPRKMTQDEIDEMEEKDKGNDYDDEDIKDDPAWEPEEEDEEEPIPRFVYERQKDRRVNLNIAPGIHYGKNGNYTVYFNEDMHPIHD